MRDTVFVLLGATGDLVIRKIIPSLYHLYSNNELPENFKVVAFARRDFNDGKYIEIIKESLGRISQYADLSESTIAKFADMFTYCQGELNSPESYEKLKSVVLDLGQNSPRLFYLSIAQSYYSTVSKNLSGILTDQDKLIVEKPFGMDESSARKLNDELLNYFTEEQIYRIDHYFAKTLIRKIIEIRKSNEFKNIWNSENIKSIRITTLEENDVKTRGDFYEQTGALKDVGQNHLLAIASLLTCSLDFKTTEEFSQKRLEALKNIPEANSSSAIRSQYKEYRSTANVNPSSRIETYFKLVIENNGPIFKSLPITVEGGKGLPKTKKVIEVEFNDAKLTFDYAKDNVISLKKNSEDSSHILYDGADIVVQYTAEYSTMILECIKGDKTYFPSAEEIFEMWRIVDPVIEYWQSTEDGLTFY